MGENVSKMAIYMNVRIYPSVTFSEYDSSSEQLSAHYEAYRGVLGHFKHTTYITFLNTSFYTPF